MHRLGFGSYDLRNGVSGILSCGVVEHRGQNGVSKLFQGLGVKGLGPCSTCDAASFEAIEILVT